MAEKHRKVASFRPPLRSSVYGAGAVEQREHVGNGRIASRGRERKQFAPTRPQIRNKTAFSLVCLGKDTYICSSDPPQLAARQGSPVVFAAAEALFTTFLKH